MGGFQPQDWQPRERPLAVDLVKLGVVYNCTTLTGTYDPPRYLLPLELIDGCKLKKLIFVVGDTITLNYQLLSFQTGFPVDITGNDLKFGMKLDPAEVAYLIGPVDGVIVDGTEGTFSFTFLVPDTPNDGVYEIEMTAPVDLKLTLTTGGGQPASIRKDIIT